MLRASLLLLVATSLAPATAAQVGSPPPELSAVRWLNSPPLTLEALRGRAVRVQVFRTWSEPATSEVPALNAMNAKECGKELFLIAVTNEEPDLVERWSLRNGASYPIAVLRGSELEAAIGVGESFPVAAVVDPEGTLIYAGYEPESALATALETASKQPLYPKFFDKTLALLRARELPEARAELHRVCTEEKLGDVARQVCNELTPWLEAQAGDALTRARQAFEQGLIRRAVELSAGVARAKPPFPASADAAALLAQCDALSNYKLELRGGSLFDEGQALEDARRYEDAVELYRSIPKKFSGTKVADAAAARAQELVARGMPGFDATCKTCVQANKACDQHKKDMKS